MKFLQILFLLMFISLNATISYSGEKADCSKINNKTIAGNIKYILCKKNSDKLDKDGNFKKGAFNIFKKKK